MPIKLLERISYQGDLRSLLSQIAKDYGLGDYRTHKVVPFGYEDLNAILETDQVKCFVKVFAKFRNFASCKRYVGIMEKVVKAGVVHPKLYESSQGFLHRLPSGDKEVRLCVMQYVDGKSFYELKAKPTNEEMRFLVRQAVMINSLDLKPSFVYDTWAITNFLRKYSETKEYLEDEDNRLIAPLVEQFRRLSLNDLPYCFVHGDIIKTNVIKDKEDKLYILDFSVSNWYPRIQELAVLLCNLLFDEDNPDSFSQHYQLALDEYQKKIHLSKVEAETLPLFLKVAHAMHILGSLYEKAVRGNTSPENEYWLNLGRIGLRYTSSHNSE